MKYSIRTKILLLLCALVFVPVLLIGIQVVLKNYEYNRDYIDSIIEKALDQELNLVSNKITERKYIVDNASNYYGYMFKEDIGDHFINEKLTEIRRSADSYINVYISTEAGKNYLSDHQQQKVDGRERPWYTGAIRSKGIFISEPYKDVITGKSVITFSNVIKTQNEKIEGVIGFDILIDDLIESILSINKNYKPNYIIINDSGDELYRDPALVNLETNKIIGQSKIEYNKINYSVKNRYMSDLKTMIYILTNNELYYTKIKSTMYESVFMLMGVLLIIITLGQNIAFRVSKPIISINEIIKDNIELDEDGLVYDTEYMELNKLAAYYSKFSKKIKEKIDELENNVKVLESKNIELMDTNFNLEKTLIQLREYDARIRESEKLYDGMVQSIPDYIWVINPQGNVTYVNESFAQKMELEKAQLETMTIEEILDETHKESLIEVLSKRKYDNIEVKFRTAQSHQKISISITSARAFQDDKMIFIHCLGRDVNDEKELYNTYLNRVFEQKMMADIAGKLEIKFDLKNILKTVIEKIISYIDVEVCTIRLLDEYGYLNLIDRYGTRKEYFTMDKIHIDDGHMGMAILLNKVQIIRGENELVYDYKKDRKIFERAKEIIFLPLISMNNKLGVISIAVRESIDENKHKTLENLAKSTALSIEKSILYESLKGGYIKIIQVLSEAVDYKDVDYKGHSKRVAEYSVIIGNAMYLEDSVLDELRLAGLLHDIGKIGVGDEILRKKLSLVGEEKEKFYEHIEISKKILEPIGLSEDIMNGIYYHHKNFDLSGRPFDVDLDELPLFAKIIQVADEFDHKMHKSDQFKEGIEKIREEFREISGSKLCPHTVRVLEELLVNNFHEIKEISNL